MRRVRCAGVSGYEGGYEGCVGNRNAHDYGLKVGSRGGRKRFGTPGLIQREVFIERVRVRLPAGDVS